MTQPPAVHPLFSGFFASQGSEVRSLSLSEIVDSYIVLYAGGRSHTARAKRIDLAHFMKFLRIHAGVKAERELSVADWDPSACQAFVDDCLKRSEAPATVARRLATIKHMGRIFAERVPGFINPAREVAPPKTNVLRPHSLNREEAAQVRINAATPKKHSSQFAVIRDFALVTVLLDTGLRADEIRTLRRKQLGESLEWLERVRTKGRRFRNVYLASNTRSILAEYLAARSEVLKKFFPDPNRRTDAELPLFVSTHGAQAADPESFLLGSKSVWRIVRACSADTKLHPHLLRHTFATDLLEGTKDIRLVAQALGHSDVRVTMRYTERFDEEIAAAVEKTRSSSSKSDK